jgi:hypothetical protein
MRVLKEKETELINLAVQEGIIEIQNGLWVDFKVKHSHLTVHQKHRLSQIEELLYTLFCEVVEENGFLQSEYDQ